MALGINNDLQQFFNFATQATRVGQAAEITGEGEVRAASKTAGAFARRFSSSADAKEAIDINNRVREAFVGALKRQFNVDDFTALPKRIKDALVGSHAFSAEGDFDFNGEGRVTSGKPLTARRIKSVMTAFQEVAQSVDLAHGASPEMQGLVTIKGRPVVLEHVSHYIATGNLANRNILNQKMNESIFNPGGFDIYGQAASPSEGLTSKATQLGIPKSFANDYYRTTFFILPGLGKVSYRPGEEQKAADDVTVAVTKGRVQHFKDLTGKDLKKVLFAMTMMNQTTANSAHYAMISAFFKKDETGFTPCGCSKADGGAISVELVVEDNGDIVFKTSNRERYDQFVGFAHPEIEGADKERQYDLNPEKSCSVATIELRYSSETIERILDADWDGMPENDLKNLIMADTCTCNAELHLEE